MKLQRWFREAGGDYLSWNLAKMPGFPHATLLKTAVKSYKAHDGKDLSFASQGRLAAPPAQYSLPPRYGSGSKLIKGEKNHFLCHQLHLLQLFEFSVLFWNPGIDQIQSSSISEAGTPDHL